MSTMAHKVVHMSMETRQCNIIYMSCTKLEFRRVLNSVILVRSITLNTVFIINNNGFCHLFYLITAKPNFVLVNT